MFHLFNIDRLLSLAKEKGVKQAFISELIGGYRGKVTDWKNKKSSPSDEELRIIADYFSISVDYLCGATDEPSINKKEAPHEGRQLNEKRKRYMTLYEELSEDEELMKYAEYIKSKRNQ